MANDIEIRVRVANQTGTGITAVNQAVRQLRQNARQAGPALDAMAARAGLADAALNGLESAAQGASRALTRLRGRAAAAANALGDLRDNATLAGAGLWGLAARATATSSRLSDLRANSAQLGDGLGDLDGRVTRLTAGLRGLGDGSGRLGDDLTRVRGRLDDMADSAADATGAIGSKTGGGGMAGAIAAAGVAALSVLPALGSFAPMLTGAAVAGITAKMAFSGVGDAVKLAGEDQKEYAKVLKKMPPAQREFTKTIVAAKKEFGGLTKEVQKIALPKFTAGLKAAAPALKTFEGGVKDMARVLGDLGKDAGEFIAGPRFRSALKKNMEMGAGFIDRFVRSLGSFSMAFLEFGAKSKATLDALGGGLSDVLGKGLPGMFRGLEQGIGGSAKMFTGLFDALNMILPALGRLSGSLANTFGPVLGAVFRHIGRLVTAVMDGLRPAIDELKPLMDSAAEGMDRVGGAVRPLGEFLGKALGAAVKMAIIPMRNLFDLMVTAVPFVKSLGAALLGSVLPAFGSMNGSMGWADKLSSFVKNNRGAIQEIFAAGSDAVMRFAIAIVDGLPKAFGIFRVLATVALEAFGLIVQGAAMALGFIPGIGEDARKAADGFRAFKDGVYDNLDAAGGKLNEFRDSVLPKLENNRLRMNISNWQTQIATAREQLSDENLPPEKRGRLLQNINQWNQKIAEARKKASAAAGAKYEAKIRADKSNFDAKANAVRGTRFPAKVAKILGNKASFNATAGAVRAWRAPSKTVPIRGNARNFWGTVGGIAGRVVGSAIINLVGRRVGKKATGGIIGAAAAGGPRGNTTLVGEQGPELVDLAPGSMVHTAGDTRRIMQNRGGGQSGPVVIELRSSGNRTDDMLLEMLRRAIHVRGGDPNVVLRTNRRGG